MSPLQLAGGAAWKVATIVLLALLLVMAAAGGMGWWLAAGARDQALADLKAEQGVSAELRAGINAQNGAIAKLGEERLAAEARGVAAQQLAAAAGRRYDAALESLAGARVTSCADAMPYVNRMLQDLK